MNSNSMSLEVCAQKSWILMGVPVSQAFRAWQGTLLALALGQATSGCNPLKGITTWYLRTESATMFTAHLPSLLPSPNWQIEYLLQSLAWYWIFGHDYILRSHMGGSLLAGGWDYSSCQKPPWIHVVAHFNEPAILPSVSKHVRTEKISEGNKLNSSHDASLIAGKGAAHQVQRKCMGH